MRGKIIRSLAGFYDVYCYEDGLEYRCRARGIFRKDKFRPLVGDEAEFTVTHAKDMEGSLDGIEKRKNFLVRPPVANIDQALVVFALASPDPNLFLLDRFLVRMEKAGIPAIILFNKEDLVTEEEVREYERIYRGSGCRVLTSCVRDGIGVKEVLELMRGRTTVLAGPSGVGKSSLTNILCPEAEMEVGEVSRKTERGKQTTRHAELFAIGSDTFFLDTPGFSSLFLEDLKPEEVRRYFREFREHEGQCRYEDCMHISEPDCEIKRAVEAGEISRERYENYVRMVSELREVKRY